MKSVITNDADKETVNMESTSTIEANATTVNIEPTSTNEANATAINVEPVSTNEANATTVNVEPVSTNEASATAVNIEPVSTNEANATTINIEPTSTNEETPMTCIKIFKEVLELVGDVPIKKATPSFGLGRRLSAISADLPRASAYEKQMLGAYSDINMTALSYLSRLTSTIMWMMITYLTDVWKFSYNYAAGVRNVWSGAILVLPLILIHVADSFTGDYYIISLGSTVYTVGLGILSASNPPASCDDSALRFSTCAKREKGNLYAGLAISALGLAGIGTSMTDFQARDGKAQDDDIKRYLSFKTLFILLVLGSSSIVLFLIYFEKIKSWHAIYLIVALYMAFASLCFISGKRMYKVDTDRPKSSENSLIVIILRVLVASASKILYTHPRSQDLLYKDDNEIKPLDSTKGFRCLDKAAIISPGVKTIEEQKSRWTLCSVTDVEKTKMVFRMFPLWATWITMGVVSSMGDTYFQEQASSMNPKLGKLKVPVVALLGFQTLAGLAFGKFVNWAYEKGVPRQHQRARPAILVAMAMVASTLCCIVAAKVEKKRLGVVLRSGLIDKPDDKIPMTMFILVPQFILLGVLDKLFDEGSKRFVLQFIDTSMIKYMILSTGGIKGFGRIGGVLSVFLVGKINHWKNRDSWFQSTLNRSRLDNYYWVLAACSAVCLVAYASAVFWYYYRENNRPRQDDIDDMDNSNMVEETHWWCWG